MKRIVVQISGGVVQGAISDESIDLLVVDSDIVDGGSGINPMFEDPDGDEFEANAYHEKPLINKKLVDGYFKRADA